MKRSWLAPLARGALTGAVLIGLVIWLPADQLLSAARRVGLGLWILAVAAAVLGHVVAASKWWIVLRAVGARPSYLSALRAHASGLFAGIWLPSLVGGDVVRAGLLWRGGYRLENVTTAGVGDRVTDAGALILLASIGSALTPGALHGSPARVLAGATVALLLVATLFPLVIRVVPPGWLPARHARSLVRLRVAMSTLLVGGRSSLAAALLVSVVVQGSFVLVNVGIGSAVGIHIPLEAWLMAWPLAKLVALLPISLGGIGVREVALATLLAPFGVDPTLSVAQSFVWETVMLALGLTAGLTIQVSRKWARGSRSVCTPTDGAAEQTRG